MNVEELKRLCREACAQTDGELFLEGLRSAVEVIRDEWGVPHIYAADEHDLFFAQGFVAAQDRLFQMDWWRRVAVGETAEILGPAGVEGDRFARLVRYRGDWSKEWASYGPRARDIAESFVAGINAFIEHARERLPVEFQILGYQPARWKAEDCLGRMSGVIMARNAQQELQRAQLIAEVGIEKARMIAPADPAHDYDIDPQIDVGAIDPSAILRSFLAATEPVTFHRDDGSNNWVVDGSRSASGMPLLASDPHRTIGMPSLRYLVHLNAPGWNVIGSGEPGLPGVAAGHNDQIAWGFTIICTDQADFFVEETSPGDNASYRVDDHWQAMEVVREQIQVRGADPVELELRFTRHGPVIYQDDENHLAYALRWVGSEPGAAAYLGSLAVDQAGNWDEFLTAMQSWKMPSENMVYADRQGNVGWIAAAMTPVRPLSDGMLPVPGAGSRHEWQRFLEVHELPQAFNPPEPIVTANHNILPEGYENTIAYEWAPYYRFQRIKERIAAKHLLNLDDMASMQHDCLSIPGRRLSELAGEFSIDDPPLDALRQEFSRWDGDLARDSRPAVIYGFWIDRLLNVLFSKHVSARLLPFVAGQNGIPVLLDALAHPSEAWFGPEPLAERKRLLQTTFAAAVELARQQLGEDAAGWAWGKLHTVSFIHPLSHLGDELANVLDRGPCAQAGDGLCPNATRHELPLPNDRHRQFRQVSGASYRHLFDLADWDRGLATSAPGQSGQPESPHYDDLLALWERDEFFPLVFSREMVERHARQRLWLRPLSS